MQTEVSDSFKQAAQFHRQNRFDEAQKLYLQILEQDPKHMHVLCNLAYLYMQKQDLAKSLETVNKAIATDPNHGNSYNVLGMLLVKQGKAQEAVNTLQKAIEYKAANRDTFSNLALAATELKDYILAAKAWKGYIDLAPFAGLAIASLMHCQRRTLVWSGLQDLELKIKNLVHAKEGNMPNFPLLFSELSPEELLLAARSRAHYLRQVSGDFTPPKKAARLSGEKIKIGYFSSDIGAHPVGLMSHHLYRNHDRSEFEVYAYAAKPPDDTPIGKGVRQEADHFRELSQMSDDEAANTIRADDLDILIDLSGHTKNTRQEILLRRPAPVMINYLGFIGTMGSDYHNYIIADRYLIPEDQKMYFTETPIYVSCAYAYERVYSEPQKIGTRAEHNLPEDAVVVGCFHQGAKINPTVFNAWMRVLQACPEAHLWLPRHDEVFEANFKTIAAGYNVPESRMTFGDIIELQYHQGRYEHVDIVADAFPYNGGATSADALHAGVPMVTFGGRTMIGRVGASLLMQLGMQDFIANSTADYIQKLCKLIQDPDRLRSLKPQIREQARQSKIFDGKNMTRELEEAYRRIVALRQ